MSAVKPISKDTSLSLFRAWQLEAAFLTATLLAVLSLVIMCVIVSLPLHS